MKHRTMADLDAHAMAAAYLRSMGQMQRDIAGNLGISQPEVSRLLQRASERGWLKFPTPSFCPDSAREVWQKAQNRFFSYTGLFASLKALEPKGKSHLHKLTVLPGPESFGRGVEETSRPVVEETLGAVVVQALAELLPRVRIMGVTWGRTINKLVEVLGQHLTAAPRRQNPIRFVPLCGEPLKARDPVGYSSSALAAQLCDIINGPRADDPPPSLAGVPAFIPSQFRKSEVQIIRRFLRQVAGYDAVFGEPPQQKPWIDLADTFLTSVGVVAPEGRGIFLKERVDLGDIAEADLTDWVVGDIGGIIIPRRGLDRLAASRIKEMNDRWTGFQMEHLERCAREGSRNGAPGVVVMALEEKRSAMVRRCFELGLVNVLIIDQKLAHHLTDNSLKGAHF